MTTTIPEQLFDKEALRSASVAFALEFQMGDQPTLFTECTSELDTTVEEETEQPMELSQSAENESPPVQMTLVEPDKSVEKLIESEELVRRASEIEDIRMEMKPRKTSSRLIIQNIAKLSESKPKVSHQNSEEEGTTTLNKQKKRQSPRLQELRQHQKEVEKAVKSTLITFGKTPTVINKKKITLKQKLAQSWRDMYRLTCNWLRKLHDKEVLRKSSFHTFLLNGVHALRRTVIAAQPRAPEVHEITLRFIVDFNKIFEVAKLRGMQEIIGTMGRFVESVIGHYLSSPSKMNPTSLAWIQTKEVIKLLMTVTLQPDSAYGFLQLFSRIQMYFIAKCAIQPNRNEEFIAYAVSQIQFFTSILSERLEILAAQKKYCMQF